MEEIKWENLDEGKTSKDFLIEGERHERVYNPWTAEASYKLAGDEGKKHREALIRKEAYKNPTRAFLMLEEDDDKKLYRLVQECADKKKLHLLRDYISKNF